MILTARRFRNVVLSAIAFWAFGCIADADAADNIALPKPYTGFLAGTKALTASASDFADLERAAQRLKTIRSALAKRLLGANAASKLPLNDLVEERNLLCEPRAAHLATLARLNYLNSIVSQVDETSNVSKPDSLLSAVTLLFAKYSIDGTAKSLEPGTLTAVGDRARSRCETDIKGFDVAYYGVDIRAPSALAPAGAELAAPEAISALALLGPVGALIDTFLNVVGPVAIGAATLVDETKREQAIHDFLSKPENQANLKTIGEQIGGAASRYNWDKRLRLAAAFVEGVRVVQNFEVDLSKLPECKDLSSANLGRTASGAPSTAFMVCWRKVWGQVDETVASILKAGQDYDQLADAGDTDTALIAFRKVTADLNAVAANEITDPAVFWMYVTQVITFATTVQAAFSQDNRDKIHKAIDALVKAP
jgi:hypothetical protein